MKNVFNLFLIDWKRIIKNKMALIIIGGIMVIPSLYAWFNIEALWDPYGNTSTLPVAVLSEDKGTTLNNEDINVGDEVITNLHDNHDIGWVFTDSRENLDKGVNSGEYFAGIVITENFSEDLVNYLSTNVKKPQIDYIVNQKVNAIAPKISDEGVASIKEEITANFIGEVANSVVDQANIAGTKLADNEDVITSAKGQILQLDENMGEYSELVDSVHELNRKMPQMQEKVDSLGKYESISTEIYSFNDDLTKLVNGLDKYESNIESANKLVTETADVEKLKKQVTALNNDVAGQITSVNNVIEATIDDLTVILSDISNTIEDANDNILKETGTTSSTSSKNTSTIEDATTKEAKTKEVTTKEVTTEEATTDDATTKEATTKEATTEEITTKEATTEEITTEEATTEEATTEEITTEEATTKEATANTVVELEAATVAQETSSTATNSLSSINQNAADKVVDEINNIIDDLTQISKRLEAEQAKLDNITNTIDDAEQTIDSSYKEIESFYKNEYPEMKSDLVTLNDYLTNDFPATDQQIKGDIDQIQSTFPVMATDVNNLDVYLATNFDVFAADVNNVADQIRNNEDVELELLVEVLLTSPDKVSNYLKDPVEINEVDRYSVPNYGSQSAPFYTALCLWVGAVLLTSVLSTKFHDVDVKYTVREKYVARLLTFLAIAVVQALIVSLGNVYILKTYIVSPYINILCVVFIGICFNVIVYTLAALFDNIGKALAVILLVLSVAGGGGNFPIQLSSNFFQIINPLLPFTHAVNLLRETVGGIYVPVFVKSVVILALDTILFLIIGITFAPQIIKLTDKMVRSANKSKIFH